MKMTEMLILKFKNIDWEAWFQLEGLNNLPMASIKGFKLFPPCASISV